MSVVNVKVKFIRPEYENLEEWIKDSDKNVYIGRGRIVYINGVRYPPKDSPFCNPYKIGILTREEVLTKYKIYLLERIKNENSSKTDKRMSNN